MTESALPDTAPTAPPTDRSDYVAPPPHRTWPTAIGIIAIIFGSLGALGALWGAAAPFLMEWLFDAMGLQQAEVQAQLEIMRSLLWWSVSFSLVSLLLALLLLMAGVQLIRRRRQAGALCWWWAVLKMALVVGGVALGYVAQQQQMELMTAQQQSHQQMAGAVSEAMALFNIAIGLAWGWALPVFMLIWFSRRSVKADVASWR
ncbi:MAG: hypothetical protein WD534_17245 [Phycisphaeraceae bacterium]